MKAIIYHNPRCSKSRQALEILNKQNIDTTVMEYLKTPPDAKQLKKMLKLLDIPVRNIMRSKEAEYKENNLGKQNFTDDELIAYLVKFPKLLERPIVIYNNKAIICRPPELVLGIL